MSAWRGISASKKLVADIGNLRSGTQNALELDVFYCGSKRQSIYKSAFRYNITRWLDMGLYNVNDGSQAIQYEEFSAVWKG